MGISSPRKRFKVLTVPVHDAEKYLNEAAAEGWVLVSTVVVNQFIVYTMEKTVY